MGINLNLTNIVLVGSGALVLYYMYTKKIPPFDNLEFPGLESEPNIETVPDETGGIEGAQPDVIPGKEGLVADFYKGETHYPEGGGTSGDLEDDFFITLARQKALLGDTPVGGGSGRPIETGDAPLNQGGYPGSNNPAGYPGAGVNYNNITFDKYGNTVIVPIPQNAYDITGCKSSCMIVLW